MSNETMPEWKQRTLARFTEWLESQPNDAPPEEAADEPADLYTLAAELTALKQEMRTLGRTTAQLSDSSRGIAETLKEELPALLKAQTVAPASAPDREALTQARRAAEHPFLVELGDLSTALNELRDRAVEPAWPFYVPASVRDRLTRAQAKPLEVLTARVGALLGRHGLVPLAAVGEPFAAARMNAAGVSSEGAVASGCISAVVRQGFVCGEEILRMAEVVVEKGEE
jgi:molecular chaperone GrpE